MFPLKRGRPLVRVSHCVRICTENRYNAKWYLLSVLILLPHSEVMFILPALILHNQISNRTNINNNTMEIVSNEVFMCLSNELIESAIDIDDEATETKIF